MKKVLIVFSLTALLFSVSLPVSAAGCRVKIRKSNRFVSTCVSNHTNIQRVNVVSNAFVNQSVNFSVNTGGNFISTSKGDVKNTGLYTGNANFSFVNRSEANIFRIRVR